MASQVHNPVVLVPARMASTRLPGKPLADIRGEPLIVHVWRRAMAAGVGPVVVACAEREIAEAVTAAGGTAMLTRVDHPSGSDRIFEALSRFDPEGQHDVVVNLQGDLPCLDSSLVRAALLPLADEDVDIATLVAPIVDPAEDVDPNVVKVALSLRDDRTIGRAVYFSRAPVPWGEGPLWHHIGLYAYRRQALARFVTLPPGVLETRERLEQLRALENGMRIDAAVVDTVPLGVDTPADLERARAMPAGAGAMTTAPTAAVPAADPNRVIAFQGAPGAYSDLACRTARPELATLPCRSFEDAFAAVRDGNAGLAMIPIENSVAGRVADIHHLLPNSGLHIIGEHYQRVNHHLLALPGARIERLTHVHSHIHALNQCRGLIRELNLEAVVRLDTAGAAAEIAAAGDRTQAVIASELAGDIYGLVSLRENIEDARHNTTRFLIMAKEPVVPHPKSGPAMTSFVFRVRNVPAALYKALGGFATNGVNMTKLESYLVGGRFNAAQFYAEVEGHPEHRNLKLALEELDFFSREVRILGVYPQHPYRWEGGGDDPE